LWIDENEKKLIEFWNYGIKTNQQISEKSNYSIIEAITEVGMWKSGWIWKMKDNYKWSSKNSPNIVSLIVNG
jgi:hypothetical protein